MGSPDPLSTPGCLAQAQAQKQHHLRLQAKRRGQHTRTALSQVADVLLLANLPGACPPCSFCAEPILIGLALLTKTKDTGYITQYTVEPCNKLLLHINMRKSRVY